MIGLGAAEHVPPLEQHEHLLPTEKSQGKQCDGRIRTYQRLPWMQYDSTEAFSERFQECGSWRSLPLGEHVGRGPPLLRSHHGREEVQQHLADTSPRTRTAERGLPDALLGDGGAGRHRHRFLMLPVQSFQACMLHTLHDLV